jgi:hypothetical protein
MYAFSVVEYSISLDYVKTVRGVSGISFFDWSREIRHICCKAGDHAIAFDCPLDELKITKCIFGIVYWC